MRAAASRTIALLSALPTITNAVLIDGTSQTGWAIGAPVIELRGDGAGAGVDGLTLGADNVSVSGLIINRFNNYAIFAYGANDSIVGNWIGIGSDGITARANNGGINLEGTGEVVGGSTAATRNVISGNTHLGVLIDGGASGNTIEGNYIGTDSSGLTAVANGFFGVDVEGNSTGNTVGGTASGAGNLIAGNTTAEGVAIRTSSHNNTVLGNTIGLNAAGNILRNGIGVLIDSGATANTIGGTAAGARNVISGNNAGVFLDGSTVTGNFVLGNYIGTDASGASAQANGTGIEILDGANGNTIGGQNVVASQSFTITGSSGPVLLTFQASVTSVLPLAPTASQVQNALNSLPSIGGVGGSTSVTLVGNTYTVVFGGTLAYSVLPSLQLTVNGVGEGVTIVSQGSLARNVISGNTGDGVDITGSGTTGNVIQGNYIGTDEFGTTAAPNGGAGVSITAARQATPSAVHRQVKAMSSAATAAMPSLLSTAQTTRWLRAISSGPMLPASSRWATTRAA